MSTAISWTSETWNPVTGCTKVSAGCAHCYAERISQKFGWSDAPWTVANEARNIKLHPERLNKLNKFKPGSRIFVNSMSDMFHRLVPDEFIDDIFSAMVSRPDLIFQCLTKRAERASEWHGPWPEHIWLGVSVEDKRSLSRIDLLRKSKANVKFISFEPLLEDLCDIDLAGIDWVIVGGESGQSFRPMQHAWARNIRDACKASDTAFFFKQSAAWRTEIGTALQHEDGSFWKWEQYPNVMTAPIMVSAPVNN